MIYACRVDFRSGTCDAISGDSVTYCVSEEKSPDDSILQMILYLSGRCVTGMETRETCEITFPFRHRVIECFIRTAKETVRYGTKR